MTALTESDAAAYLKALLTNALAQMADGWPAAVIVSCIEENLAWIEAQRCTP